MTSFRKLGQGALGQILDVRHRLQIVFHDNFDSISYRFRDKEVSSLRQTASFQPSICVKIGCRVLLHASWRDTKQTKY